MSLLWEAGWLVNMCWTGWDDARSFLSCCWHPVVFTGSGGLLQWCDFCSSNHCWFNGGCSVQLQLLIIFALVSPTCGLVVADDHCIVILLRIHLAERVALAVTWQGLVPVA